MDKKNNYTDSELQEMAKDIMACSFKIIADSTNDNICDESIVIKELSRGLAYFVFAKKLGLSDVKKIIKIHHELLEGCHQGEEDFVKIERKKDSKVITLSHELHHVK